VCPCFLALKYLYLDSNGIEAPLAGVAGSAIMSADSPPLLVLSLYQNRLTGTIPAEIGQLTELEWLNLGWNRMTGPVPVELLEMKNLKYMWLQANQLSGEFPGSGAGVIETALPRLRSLKLDGNTQLRGCLALTPCQNALVIEAGREVEGNLTLSATHRRTRGLAKYTGGRELCTRVAIVS